MILWVDADACPRSVKEILCRVSDRLQIPVRFVANTPLRVPESPLITFLQVRKRFDGADDLITEQAGPGDIVITADIPLADRIVRKGAVGIDPRGRTYTEDNVGEILATRHLLSALRTEGLVKGGPGEFGRADRARFCAALDREITRSLKKAVPS